MIRQSHISKNCVQIWKNLVKNFYFKINFLDINITSKEKKKFVEVILETLNMKLQRVGMHVTQIFDEWKKGEEFLVVVIILYSY